MDEGGTLLEKVAEMNVCRRRKDDRPADHLRLAPSQAVSDGGHEDAEDVTVCGADRQVKVACTAVTPFVRTDKALAPRNAYSSWKLAASRASCSNFAMVAARISLALSRIMHGPLCLWAFMHS